MYYIEKLHLEREKLRNRCIGLPPKSRIYESQWQTKDVFTFRGLLLVQV